MSISILIVDDNADDAALLQLALAAKAADVTTIHAGDGDEAKRLLLLGTNVDLLLLDYYLPKRDALELVEWLRKEDLFPTCPIAILTGHVPPLRRDAALKAGISLFLDKPTDWNGYLEIADRLILLCETGVPRAETRAGDATLLSGNPKGELSSPQRRETMNRDTLQGNWMQLKGHIKEQWGRLTDDDMDVIDGRREKLLGMVQERYGIAREEAEEQLEKWEESHLVSGKR